MATGQMEAMVSRLPVSRRLAEVVGIDELEEIIIESGAAGDAKLGATSAGTVLGIVHAAVALERRVSGRTRDDVAAGLGIARGTLDAKLAPSRGEQLSFAELAHLITSATLSREVRLWMLEQLGRPSSARVLDGRADADGAPLGRQVNEMTAATGELARRVVAAEHDGRITSVERAGIRRAAVECAGEAQQIADAVGGGA